MRKLVLALTAAAGFALLPTTGALAAPFGGTVLDNAASATAATIDVRYGRHHCCCCCKTKVITVTKWKKVWCCGCPRWIKVKVKKVVKYC
jgi:hypothetical protein